MSAYQVNPDTVDLITAAAIEYDFHEMRGHPVTVYFASTATIYTAAARALVSEVGTRADGVMLVRFDLPPTLVTDDGATAGDILGRELVAANVASVAARYPSDTRTDMTGGMVSYLPDDYTYTRVTRDRFADYGHVLGALACFEYQSSETQRDTLADAICDRVRRDVCMKVADACQDDTGVGTWNWNRDDARAARAALRAEIVRTVTA